MGPCGDLPGKDAILEVVPQEVVKSALNAYDKMVEKDAAGVEHMYRPRGWNEVERAKRRRAKKEDWFKGGHKRCEGGDSRG